MLICKWRRVTFAKLTRGPDEEGKKTEEEGRMGKCNYFAAFAAEREPTHFLQKRLRFYGILFRGTRIGHRLRATPIFPQHLHHGARKV